MGINYEKTMLENVLENNEIMDIFTEKSKKYLAVRKFNNTEVVLYDKDEFSVLSIVIEGKLKVVPSSMEGKNTFIDYIEKGEVLGEIEYFCKRQNIHTVVACEQTILLDIPFCVIEEELKDYAPFLHFVCNRLSEKLCNLSINHSKQLLMSTKVQLCQYIMEAVLRCECYSIPIKYVEIAQQTGKSDRHIRRIVSELIEEGIVLREERGFIRVVDYQSLEKIVSGI